MKRTAISVLMVLTFAGLLSAQTDLQPIATVKLTKSEPITLKQVKVRVEAMQMMYGKPLTVEQRRSVLDEMINERLLAQAAEKNGVKVADSEVSQSFSQMLSQQVGQQITEAEFAQMLKESKNITMDEFMRTQTGMGVADYKAMLKTQLLAQRFVLSKKQAEIQSLPEPTNADIRKNYELYKKNFVQGDMVKIFMILVPKASDAAAAHAKVAELNTQVKAKPASTAEIRIRSQAENSGFQAGELYFSKDSATAQQLGMSMDNLLKIFGMEINQVSEISETDQDYRFFVMQEKYAAKILELSDVVKPGTNVTVYEYIKKTLIANNQNKAFSDALAQIVAELRVPENFQILKSDADLEKALVW